MLPRLMRIKIVAALILLNASFALAQDATLQSGDVVQLDIVGLPELQRRSSVGPDGKVSLPLFGEILVAGRSLSEIRSDLRSHVSTIIYRRRGPSDALQIVPIEANDILFDVIEQRPAYATGDVAKPGPVAYRQGLTVREAVAIAGGYDLLRMRARDPFIESEDLREEYISLWTDYAAQQAKTFRIEAILAGRSAIDSSSLSDLPVDKQTISTIVRNEEQQLEFNLDAFSKQSAYLDSAANKISSQLTTLAEQQDLQTKEVASAKQELQQMQSLMDRGLVQSPRVIDARRAILMAATLELETAVAAIRAEAQRSELIRDKQRLSDDRVNALQNDLAATKLEAQRTRTRLQTTGQKLEYTGLLRGSLIGNKDTPPEIEIHRPVNGVMTVVRASEDTVLSPGDVFEVALKVPLEKLEAAPD